MVSLGKNGSKCVSRNLGFKVISPHHPQTLNYIYIYSVGETLENVSNTDYVNYFNSQNIGIRIPIVGSLKLRHSGKLFSVALSC